MMLSVPLRSLACCDVESNCELRQLISQKKKCREIDLIGDRDHASPEVVPVPNEPLI